MPTPNPTVRRDHRGGAAVTTLAAGITNVDTTFTVASATGWPDGTIGPWFVVIDAGTASEEKVLCSARSGTSVTVAASGRGVDGTTATGHALGATVWHTWAALEADEANAHTNATSGVHGAAGSVVGTTDPQTLTNKTLTSPTVTDFANAQHNHGTAGQGGGLRDTVSTASAATAIPLVAKQAASQTADTQQWQDSTGATLGRVDSAGTLWVPKSRVGPSGSSAALAAAAAAAAGDLPFEVRAAAGQTQDLMRVADSTGAMLLQVTKLGNLAVGGGNDDTAVVYAVAKTTGQTPLVTDAPAGQAANLVDLRVAGTSKAQVDPAGSATFNNVTAAGTVTASGAINGNNTALLNPPRTIVSRTTAQTIPNNTITNIVWQASEDDTGGFWASTPNPERVTIPGAGRYQIVVNLPYVPNATGLRQAQLTLNGVTNLMEVSLQAPGGNTATLNFTHEGMFSAADYLVVSTIQTSGGNLDTHTTNGKPRITVRRVGP